MQDGYEKLYEQINKLSAESAAAPFNFPANTKKCGVRWMYDRCLRDLLAHLHEWQVLMRVFVQREISYPTNTARTTMRWTR